MDWFKQHADTVAIITTFILCFWHLNERITTLEKDVAIIKTVLIMRNLMPEQLCHDSNPHPKHDLAPQLQQ